MKNVDALWSKICISSQQYNLKVTKYNNVRTGKDALWQVPVKGIFDEPSDNYARFDIKIKNMFIFDITNNVKNDFKHTRFVNNRITFNTRVLATILIII